MFGLFKRSSGPIAPEKLRYTPLRFDLSGNILELAIPDNVSPDMPPTELVPVVDIYSPAAFKADIRVELMKVMYDFPRPGWRKHDYGSMTVTLRVHQKTASYAGDIFQREHLIGAVQVDIKNDYTAFNDNVLREGIAAGREKYDLLDEVMWFSGDTEIYDHTLNGKLWIEYFIGGREHHRIYCTALSSDTYLSLDFEDMNASDTYFDEMMEISTPYLNAIIKTIKLTLLDTQDVKFVQKE